MIDWNKINYGQVFFLILFQKYTNCKIRGKLFLVEADIHLL